MAHRIAVIKGDGVGPEVVEQALLVLAAAAERFGFRYETTELPFCSQYFLDTGRVMEETDIDALREYDAVLLGAVGDPRLERGMLERNIVGGVRFGLDLFVNLRPVRLYSEALCPLKGVKPSDVDLLVVRENTEDLYTGPGGFFRKGTPDEVAVQSLLFTRMGVERVLRYGFERAQERKGRLTLVDKANAVKAFELWRRVLEELGQDYPDVETDTCYIDAACMYLVTDPSRFDVVVTSNVFGDIFTDLGAAVQGGMGFAPSGNIHPGKTGMFEPVHGSAPDIAGKGTANPVGAVLSVGMMLLHIGETDAGKAVEAAVAALVSSGSITGKGQTTAFMGGLVAEELLGSG